MSVRRAFAVSATDFYRNSWRLFALNALLAGLVVGVALASIATKSALALVVLVGPVAAAVMHCIVTLAQTEELRLGEAVNGLQRYWRRGLALGTLLVASIALGAIAIPFYAHAGTWAWPLAAASLYVLLALTVLQLALWPLAVYERERDFRGLLRDAALVVARRPLRFIGLGGALLAINVLGIAAAVVPFLTVTIAYSLLVAAHVALPINPTREV
jgi:hypothetical protein